MTIQYTNRIGKTYYLRQGTTKTGKTRYFFSGQKDGKGEAVDSFPDGYEIYEHPANTQVFLRKKRPQLITDREKQLVTKHNPKSWLICEAKNHNPTPERLFPTYLTNKKI